MKTGIIHSVGYVYINEGGESRGQGEGTKVKATIRPVEGGKTTFRHTIPLRIVIFLVLLLLYNIIIS